MIDERNRIEVILNSIATATPIEDPRDRIEVFISAIAEALRDATLEDLEPRDRTELILYAIAEAISSAGLIVTEALSVTENGTYTADPGIAYTPVVVNVPISTFTTKTITENGTYAASSDNVDGYSSVTVNVPLPENAYLLKTATAGDTVTFTDGKAAPLFSLKANITAVQAGTGDAAPDNERAITGWSSAIVTANTDTITIPFGTTVYGGSIDVGNGPCSITHNMAVLSDLTWSMPSAGVFRCNELSDAKVYAVNDMPNAICEIYKPNVSLSLSNYTTYGGDKSFTFLASTISLCVKDSTYDNLSDFVASLTSKKLVYELATPTTAQLTPTQISSISGSNSIAVNCGAITECKYFS